MAFDRGEHVARLFEQAADLAGAERSVFLDRACGDDAALRAEVESLLGADEGAGSFLDDGLGATAVGAVLDRTEGGGLVGRDLGGYHVLSVLGVGGMSIVYLAEQEQPRRRVALKIIKPGRATPALLRRFEHEAQILARLRHPGIAQVYDAGTHDTGAGPQPFFAMELVEGPSLVEFAERRSLDMRERLALLARVSEAVHHAHQKGVVHRDLKPGNILVDERGQPKVLDFGVARITDADVQTTTLRTGVGELIGTIPYMSPEQVAGDPLAVDTRSDIYALGVLAYELLAGRLPHDLHERRIPEALRIISEHDPVPLGSVSRMFRGDIDTIVARALEKDPDRRYQSASDLAIDVERYLRNEPIAARPPSTLYQIRKFSRRHRGLVGGVAAAFVVLLAGLVATAWQAIEAHDARERAEANQRDAEAARDEAETVTSFLAGMLAAANPMQEGKDVRVVDVLGAAVGRIGDDFAEQPRVETRLRRTIGETYLGLGELASAETQLATTLELCRARLDPGDTQTLKTMNALAVVYYQQGRIDEAVPLFEEALAIRRRTLEEDHPDTLASINNLGSMRRHQGRLDEAEPLYVDLLAAARRVFGDEHRNTVICLDNLASIYMDRAEYDRAVPLYEESLATSRRILGEEDPTTILTEHNVAGLYIRQERYEEAESMLEQTLAVARRALGAEHPLTLDAQHRLAWAYRAHGRLEEALATYESTLVVRTRVLAADHPDTLDSLRGVIETLAALGRREEAEARALDLHARCLAAYGPDAPPTRGVVQRLIELYEAWPRPEEAARWRERLE